MQVSYLRSYKDIVGHFLGISWNGIFTRPEINTIIISISSQLKTEKQS